MSPWQLEAELEQDATRDLWMERRALFVVAEQERMAPPESRKKGKTGRRIT